MKRLIYSVVLAALFQPTFCQELEKYLGSIQSSTQHLAIANAFIEVSTDDPGFWHLYASYVGEQNAITTNAFFPFDVTATEQMQNKNLSVDVQSFLEQSLRCRYKTMQLKRDYFHQISKTYNPGLALKFLQVEALIAYTESAALYRSSDAINDQLRQSKVEAGKLTMLNFFLQATEAELNVVEDIFYNFEADYEAIVGNQMMLFEQYITDPGAITPAQCKRIGLEFLRMEEQEIITQQKYFETLKRVVGAPLAVRFMTFEDYFSLRDKLNTWSAAAIEQN